MTKVSIEGTRQHSVPRVAYRFVTGAHLDGRPRTDATVFRRGTKVLGPSGRTIRWSFLSRAERAAWRLGTLAVLSGGTYGYVVAPEALYAGLSAAGAGGAEYTRRRVRRAVRQRVHYRDWVRPLHRALAASPVVAPAASITTFTSPDTYLTVPVDYATNDQAKILMRFPEGFSGEPAVKAEVKRIICDKLGISDPVMSWRVAGREPHVMVQIAPRPPRKVTMDDAREAILAAPEASPVIGIGPRGIIVTVDLNTESPHVLVSAGTGGGKSVITRTIASQLIRHGAHTIVLDLKRHSQRWLRGLPNVTYCRTAEEMHHALIAAAQEGERRNILVDEHGEEITAEMPRIVLILEEMNATIGKLQNYWASVRTNKDPKRSPAIDALQDILFMGRAIKLTVLAVAQMMTARTLGGPEARENFPVRILARYTKNAWQMLVPEIQPMPRSDRHPGRVQVCIAGQATETQVIFGKDGQARELAESRCPCHPAAGATAAEPVTVSQTVPDDHGQGEPAPVVSDSRPLTLVPDLPQPPELAGVTLTQAVADGVLGMSLDAARKASIRDPEFPPSVGRKGNAKTYDPAALMRWQANRPRAVS